MPVVIDDLELIDHGGVAVEEDRRLELLVPGSGRDDVERPVPHDERAGGEGRGAGARHVDVDLHLTADAFEVLGERAQHPQTQRRRDQVEVDGTVGGGGHLAGDVEARAPLVHEPRVDAGARARVLDLGFERVEVELVHGALRRRQGGGDRAARRRTRNVRGGVEPPGELSIEQQDGAETRQIDRVELDVEAALGRVVQSQRAVEDHLLHAVHEPQVVERQLPDPVPERELPIFRVPPPDVSGLDAKPREVHFPMVRLQHDPAAGVHRASRLVERRLERQIGPGVPDLGGHATELAARQREQRRLEIDPGLHFVPVEIVDPGLVRGRQGEGVEHVVDSQPRGFERSRRAERGAVAGDRAVRVETTLELATDERSDIGQTANRQLVLHL